MTPSVLLDNISHVSFKLSKMLVPFSKNKWSTLCGNTSIWLFLITTAKTRLSGNFRVEKKYWKSRILKTKFSKVSEKRFL